MLYFPGIFIHLKVTFHSTNQATSKQFCLLFFVLSQMDFSENPGYT